jgi:hypothetical protein
MRARPSPDGPARRLWSRRNANGLPRPNRADPTGVCRKMSVPGPTVPSMDTTDSGTEFCVLRRAPDEVPDPDE